MYTLRGLHLNPGYGHLILVGWGLPHEEDLISLGAGGRMDGHKVTWPRMHWTEFYHPWCLAVGELFRMSSAIKFAFSLC